MRQNNKLADSFQPEVLSGNSLVAVVEVKSQVGSFGNNFNNRVEEALGNATDFWAAYREGIFKPSQKPWLGIRKFAISLHARAAAFARAG